MTNKTKVILVLLDGLGDRSYAELGDRTPLAAADTPNLDRISAMGCNGIFHALAPDRIPKTITCSLPDSSECLLNALKKTYKISLLDFASLGATCNPSFACMS